MCAIFSELWATKYLSLSWFLVFHVRVLTQLIGTSIEAAHDKNYIEDLGTSAFFGSYYSRYGWRPKLSEWIFD